MNLPDIIHHTDYVALPTLLLDTLRDDLDWERRSDAPRGEYYANDSGAPYTYGRGRGVRTYLSKSWHPYMLSLRVGLEKYLSTGPLLQHRGRSQQGARCLASTWGTPSTQR